MNGFSFFLFGQTMQKQKFKTSNITRFLDSLFSHQERLSLNFFPLNRQKNLLHETERAFEKC